MALTIVNILNNAISGQSDFLCPRTRSTIFQVLLKCKQSYCGSNTPGPGLDEHRTFTMNMRIITHLSQPVWVGQREVGEGPLPLDKVPRGADVVVPRDDPLHRVPHQVDVDRVRQVEPASLEEALNLLFH